MAPVCAQAVPHFPALTSDVVDDAAILSAPTKATLTRDLALLRHRTGHRLVIATVGSLEGRAIGDYGIALFRAWRVGRKDVDDGAVLLIAPREHRVRIDVGYGLEPVLTDAAAGRVLRQIHPLMGQGAYDAAALSGERAIAAVLSASVDGTAIVPPPIPEPDVPWWAWAILAGFAAFMVGIFWIVVRAVRAALHAAKAARRVAANVAGAGFDPSGGAPPLGDLAQSMRADFDQRWAENEARFAAARSASEEHLAETRARVAEAMAQAAASGAAGNRTAAPAADMSTPTPDMSAPAAAAAAEPIWPGPPVPSDPTQWGWDPAPAAPSPDFTVASPPEPAAPPEPADDSNLYTGGSTGGGGADDKW